MALSILDGKVVYTRGANNEKKYWRDIYYKNIREANSISSLYINPKMDEEVGSKLIALGQSEFQKEVALLEAAGVKITGEESEKEFIKHFNEVLMGKLQYEKALQRLNLALKKRYQKKENRAPTIASFFTSYLQTTLTANINSFIGNNLAALEKKDFSQWDNEFDTIVTNSIMQAWEKMLNEMEEDKNKKIYGDSQTWKEIYEVSKSLTSFPDYFIKMIKSKFSNFDNIKNIFENESIKLKNKKRNGVSKVLGGKQGLNLRDGKKSRSIGGSVEEFIMSIANLLGSAAQSAVMSNGSSSSRVISSEMALADNVSVYVYEQDINIQQMAEKIAREIDAAYQDNNTLNEAHNSLQKYYNQYLSKLNKTFIVYGSTKSYTLSDSFRSFGGSEKRKLIDMPELLAQAGVGSLGDIEKFIYKAFNTAQGAIFENEKENVEEQLKKALVSAMSSLLFDDWETIGEQNGGAQCIHVLQLEGIQLPLSIILKATGKAINDTKQNSERYFKTNIYLPSEIKYKDTIAASTKSEVIEHWEEQARIASAQSEFSINFLSNFKTIIKQWI